MSDLFALQGRHDCGKTETLNNVIQLLSQIYSDAQINRIHNGKDETVIIKNIKGLTIGIETQGDPNSRLQKSLLAFSTANCDIIFCACRTSGMTVDWVKSLSKKYNIKFIKQTIVDKDFDNNNMSKAQYLLQLAGL